MPDIQSDALATAQEAIQGGDPEMLILADDLIRAFRNWETVREHAVKERKRTKENVEARLAELKEAMESGHSNDAQALLKLPVCEMAWQSLEDARAEKKEVLGALRDQMKLSETKIRELIEKIRSPQLGLFTSSTSTVDNPPVREDDDDDEDDKEDDDDQPDIT